MPTERKQKWRGVVHVSLLFVASFAATLWVIQPAASTVPMGQEHEGKSGDLSSAGIRPTAVGRGSMTGGELEVLEPTPEPTPSLHDLLADNDPATRDEARALLELLDQERTTQ